MALIKRVVMRALASPKLRARVWSRWYNYLNRKFDQRQVWFMNYGLQPEGGSPLTLDPGDEPNRVPIQLYHRVAGAVDLAGKDVLEVSCGRGGGARFVQQYLRPRRMVALDFAKDGLLLCARHHADRPIRFVCGDAMRLPYADASFDAVLNVEASHCYPDLAAFLAEVRRTLRPGGHLLYADLRRQRDADAWRSTLLGAGLTLVDEENLTPHVARALETTSDKTTALVHEVAPRLLRRAVLRFAGTRDSQVFRGLHSREVRYARFVFRK